MCAGVSFSVLCVASHMFVSEMGTSHVTTFFMREFQLLYKEGGDITKKFHRNYATMNSVYGYGRD